MNQYQPDSGISDLKINELKTMASGIRGRLIELVDKFNDSLTSEMPGIQEEIEYLMCRSVDVDNARRRFSRQPNVSYYMPRHYKKSKVRLSNVLAQIEEQSAILENLIQRFTKCNTLQTKEKVDTMYVISKKLGHRYDLQAANARAPSNSYARSISQLNTWREYT